MIGVIVSKLQKRGLERLGRRPGLAYAEHLHRLRAFSRWRFWHCIDIVFEEAPPPTVERRHFTVFSVVDVCCRIISMVRMKPREVDDVESDMGSWLGNYEVSADAFVFLHE